MPEKSSFSQRSCRAPWSGWRPRPPTALTASALSRISGMSTCPSRNVCKRPAPQPRGHNWDGRLFHRDDESASHNNSVEKGNTMPTRSKAAVLVEPNAPLVIDDVTFPDPQADQVLIKLFASGICHSQLHQIHRTPQTAHRGTPAVYPSLLGHEATGVVVAKGRQVTHVQEGDHVMTTWVDRGAVEGAPPRAPVHVQWHGQTVPAGPATWTEYTLLSERLVVPLDKEVATDVTSIIGCAVLTGAGVILNTLGVRVNESVAVFGAGGVGLCAIAAAHIVGAYPIIAVDLSDDKLAFAQRFGATHGVNATHGDPVQ